MAKKSEENIPFSPILIMEFVRQVTINRFMNGETAVKFKLPKSYYEEIKAFPLKAQTIHLDIAYDEKTEVLTVKADASPDDGITITGSTYVAKGPKLPVNMKGSMPSDINSLLRFCLK